MIKVRIVLLLLVAALIINVMPLGAQGPDRCASNYASVKQSLFAKLRSRLARAEAALADSNALQNSDEYLLLQKKVDDLAKELDSKNEFRYWEGINGIGNGWIADAPDSCVRHYRSSGPVLGTRVFHIHGSPAPVSAMPASNPPAMPAAMPAAIERSAVISRGPARIRQQPWLGATILGHCWRRSALTVWLPPVNGEWLTASCYGVNGYIHASLVRVHN